MARRWKIGGMVRAAYWTLRRRVVRWRGIKAPTFEAGCSAECDTIPTGSVDGWATIGCGACRVFDASGRLIFRG